MAERNPKTLPKSELVSSNEHPGGYTMTIPAGIKPGESFEMSHEVNFAYFPDIPEIIREHIKVYPGGQDAGVICARATTATLFMNRSYESREAVEALRGESLKAIPSSRRRTPVLEALGMTFRGLDRIRQYSEGMKRASERLGEALDNDPYIRSLERDEALATWMQQLHELQYEVAVKTYEDMTSKKK